MWNRPRQNVTPNKVKHAIIKSKRTMTLARSDMLAMNALAIFRRLGSFDTDLKGLSTRALRREEKLVPGKPGTNPRILLEIRVGKHVSDVHQ